MALKILELFGGIGACSKALKRLGIDIEIVDYVEIDKYAVASYNAINGTCFEPQDICKWDKDIEVDLLMHGSPCQDFSLAGKQAGGDEGSGTRSSLMYETIRIVEKLKPKYVIWGNVKNLLSKKHRHNFDAYLQTMEELGYTNFYQVLNAKNYGIPQNRERVFTVSIRNNDSFKFPEEDEQKNLQDFLDENVDTKIKPSCEKAFEKEYEQIINSDKEIYQCDVKSGYQDCKVGIKVSPTIRAGNNCTHVLQRFEFPQSQELKLKLKDMLEPEVEEKYYLSDKMIKYISATGTAGYKNPDCKINLDVARPLTTDPNKRAGTTNYISEDLPNNYDLNKDAKCIQIGELDIKGHDCIKRVYSDEGLSPTLTDMQGGNRQPKVATLFTETQAKMITEDGNVKRYINSEVVDEFKEGQIADISFPNGYNKGNRVFDECPTINQTTTQSSFITKINDSPLKIRKLTPKECWRLMGFDDEDYEKASKVNSNTQLYKQAGNSIVVNVLEAIFKNLLLNGKNDIDTQMTIFDFIEE